MVLALTFAPAATESVKVPVVSVPRAWVTPFCGVTVSTLMVVLPPMVVLRPKVSPVSLASSRIPPVRERLPPPRAVAKPEARRVPALSVVVPV